MDLRKILREQGVSQSDLARKLGVIRQQVSAWCNGTKNPDLESRKKIAKALGIPIVKLLDTDDTFTELMVKISTLTEEGALKVSEYIDDLNERYFQ